MSFFEELKRRKVFRAGIAYVISAWLILQVSDVVLPNIGAPDWIFKGVLLLLVLGLPLILAIAWAFELTTEGLKRETEIQHSESTAGNVGRRLDFVIIALLMTALGYFAYDKFVLSAAGPDKSIAVLPFENVSSDEKQAYFADGLSEELLNLLTKVPTLRVIARTSSFSYKGKGMKINEIADELNVAHVLAGSVRQYEGSTKVRITAQLSRANDQSTLWSNAYNVTLDDVFDVQDKIAAAVVEQLKIRLLGAAPIAKAIDPKAYQLYLQARELTRQSTPDGHEQAIDLYNEALEFEPGYAAAWTGLSENFIYLAEKVLTDSIHKVFQQTRCTTGADIDIDLDDTLVDQTFEEARCAANKALESDPNYAAAYASLGRIAMGYDGDMAAAAKYLERALQLDPADPRIIRQAAVLLANLHRVNEAIELLAYSVTRDPISSAVRSNLALDYYYARRMDEAIEQYRIARSLSPNAIGYSSWIGIALVFNNEPEAGLAEIEKEQHPDPVKDNVERRPWRLIGQAMAYHALGRKADSDAKLQLLIDDYGEEWAFSIAYVLAFRGEADDAFDWLEIARNNSDSGLSEIASEPAFENIKSDGRWLPFLRSIGKAPEQLAAIEFRITRPE